MGRRWFHNRASRFIAALILIGLTLPMPPVVTSNELTWPPLHFQRFLVGNDPWGLWRIGLPLAALAIYGLMFDTYRRFVVVALWRHHIANLPYIAHGVPIAFAAIAMMLFAMAGQLHEVYLYLVENDARFQFLVGMLVAAALSALLFLSALSLTRPNVVNPSGGAPIPLMPALRMLRYLIAIACGISPLLGLLIGFGKTHDLLAHTIASAWTSTQQLSEAGPLLISSQGSLNSVKFMRLLSPASESFAYDLTRMFFGVATLVVLVQVAFFVGLGRRVQTRLAIYKTFALATAITLLVLGLANLPLANPRDASVKVTELMQISQYYTWSVGAVVGIMLVTFVWMRETPELKILVWLVCGALSFTCFFAPVTLDAKQLVDATRDIGPLAMAAAQFMTIMTVFVAVVMASKRTGAPIILSLIAALLVLAVVTWPTQDDQQATPRNHHQSELVKAELALKSWLEHTERRAQFELYRGKGVKFPVYVFAVQGGGIYAASAAALLLANLEDKAPGFHRHVLAISGVSGGAVGAAGFSALVRRKPKTQSAADGKKGEPGPLLKDATWLATRDHLSPVLALVALEYGERAFLGLSPRTLRRWFIGSSDELTRANALEKSLACAFNSRPSNLPLLPYKCAESAFDERLLKYDDHTDKWAYPALLLNTTSVESGHRVAFSPFDLSKLGDEHLTSFRELARASNLHSKNQERSDRQQQQMQKKIADLQLAEAAVASARFPGLMPAFPFGNLTFVDGGYADNSGTATALALVSWIRNGADKTKVYGIDIAHDLDVKLVILTGEVTAPNLQSSQPTSLLDTQAPLQALLNVRSTLAVREITRAVSELKSEWKIDDEHKIRTNRAWNVGVLRLDDKNFVMQLGWTLSRTTNHIISMHVARSDLCNRPLATLHSDQNNGTCTGYCGSQSTRITQNACLIQDIIEMSKPPGLPLSTTAAALPPPPR